MLGKAFVIVERQWGLLTSLGALEQLATLEGLFVLGWKQQLRRTVAVARIGRYPSSTNALALLLGCCLVCCTVCLSYRIDSIAGGGTNWGMDELDALSANLPEPTGIALDTHDGVTDVYFGTADLKIFKLSQNAAGTWRLKRIAGNGQIPASNPSGEEPALQSSMCFVYGMNFHEGALYFADWDTNAAFYGQIRKVDANGVASVYADNLSRPNGRPVFDAEGNMYVLDHTLSGEYTIVRVDAVTKAHTTLCSLNNPLEDMVLKDGMLYVTHDWYKVIQVDISDPSRCQYTTIVGAATGGSLGKLDGVPANTPGVITKPMGVDFDAFGNLIITEGDLWNPLQGNSIRRVLAAGQPNGGNIYTIAGDRFDSEQITDSAADALQVRLRNPAFGRVAPDSSIYFSDRNANRVRKLTCTQYAARA